MLTGLRRWGPGAGATTTAKRETPGDLVGEFAARWRAYAVLPGGRSTEVRVLVLHVTAPTGSVKEPPPAVEREEPGPVTVDSTTIWQKLERCVAVLTEPFTRQEITSWFRRHHPEVKEQSLSAHIQMATEGKATGAFTTRRPLVVRIDRGLYRRWRPSGQHLATAPAEDESAGGAIDVAADDAARRHFDRAMQEVYDRARDEVGYVATGFLRMLRNRGGVDTAHMLLRSSGVSDGFVALWEKGRPDLTVEALVLDDRFRHLFDDAELDVARRRLGR